MPLPALTLTHLSVLLPDILPHAKEVPEPLVTYQARRAASEFCKRTRCWRYVATVPMDEEDEVIAVPNFTAIFEIEKASFVTDSYPQGLDLERIAFDETPLPNDPTEQGPPCSIHQVQYNTVRLYPYAAGDIHLSLFLIPTESRAFAVQADGTVADNHDVLPDYVLSQHREAIVCGTLARILAQPDRPYSNPKLAAYHRQMFSDAMDASFSQNMRGQQRARRRTRSSYF